MESSRIFVKGLPPSLTEADFRKHFSAKDREVTDVKLIPQRRIGYVGFKTPGDAAKAIKYFNKSYIRMSKIAVELAKPIADPSLNPKGHAQTRHQGLPSRAPQPQRAEVSAHALDAQTDPKKRKRQEIDPADPKLREYLQVMDSSKGAGVLADHSEAAMLANAVPVADEKMLPEDESDDEYEQIPARGEKARKLEHHADVTGDSRVPLLSAEQPANASGRDKAPGETQSVEEPGDSQTQQSGAPATDDDWLRSRTNRLLDLADPDDLPTPQAAANGSTESQLNASATDAHVSTLPHSPVANVSTEATITQSRPGESDIDMVRRTCRLFVRNLPYSAKEDDLQETFGAYGPLTEVHLPIGPKNTPKGYALVLFADPSNAVEAFQALDGTTFQGRIIHIIPANARRDEALDEYELSKLPLKKQNLIRKKTQASTNTFNWNSLYMNQDAVNESTANRLGVSKSELLDPTSSDAAVKQAIAETSIIQETKAYFVANGVDLDAFKSHKRGDTAILVKNFPYGTSLDELRTLFEESGPVLRVLMPPSGTIAIVQFAQANHAKTAFGKLAYRRIKDSVLFLEKAPKDIFTHEAPSQATQPKERLQTGVQKLNVNDLLERGDKADIDVETTSLFIRNLNFTTTTNRLAEVFGPLDGFISARVKTKLDPKKPGQTLSMGFGFAEFRSKEQAQTALQTMDGYVLDGHTLAVKASHKGLDAAEERRREDQAKKVAGQRTKVIIKNLPFQATKKDIRALFGTYGQLRSVRVPKKADYSTRGFAFADFVTAREAENALNALKDTHLLGRRLVLDFAEADAVDAEEEIEKMQRKVGRQVNKVALQKLTGGGRKKVNIGEDEEDEEG